MKLLDLDKKLCEEYGITGEVDAEVVFKGSFTKTQMNEIRNALWRARVDYIIATQIYEAVKQTTTDDSVLSQYQNKITEAKNMVKNFSQSVKTLLELIDELDAK